MELPGTGRKRDPARVQALKRWVEELLPVPPGATVMVAELECHEEGCPPVETVIAVLEGPGQTRQWKLHQPIESVTRDDVAGLAKNASSP